MPSPSSKIKKMSMEEAASCSPPPQGFSVPHMLAIWLVLSTYFICIFVWDSPPGPLRDILVPIVSPIIEGASIGQGWSVFSPDVREANYHETALITFKDGLQKLYEFPRMQKLGYWERFRSEKYRKMFFDCMPWPDFQQFLPDFAQFVVDANEWPDNPPVVVSLFHHNCRTPQPDQGVWVDRSDLPEHTRQVTYYIYRNRDAHGSRN